MNEETELYCNLRHKCPTGVIKLQDTGYQYQARFATEIIRIRLESLPAYS